MRIPDDINQWTRLKQVAFYLEVGLRLQPVYGPHTSVKDPGKQPRLTLEDRLALTPEQVLKWFQNGSEDNLGEIPLPPHVAIDLDDKSPGARSLQAFWLVQPELAKLPRVRTHRGVHLHVICTDIPSGVITLTTCDLLPDLSAQIFCDPSCNIILPPSVHPSGSAYLWEGSGTLPLIPWVELQRIFRFQIPVKSNGHQSSEWKRAYRGDLRTLDLVALCTHLGVYGACLDPDDEKHSIQCPWIHEHTEDPARWNPGDSEAVIFAPAGKIGSFRCLHGHCASRTITELLAWAESREAGVVDKFCRHTYRPQARAAADGPDGLGKDRPYFDQEEREPDCPYPAVDWGRVEINMPKGFIHEAFYPKDSILDEWVTFGSSASEATKGFIVGVILPVVAAALQRRVWIPWFHGPLFTNLYSLFVGTAGDGKTTLINWAEQVGRACLALNAFLNLKDVSPQGLFEQFYESSGGNPDNLFIFGEGNIVLRGWVETTIGGAVASELLDRYDCKAYRETYIRNKKENKGNATRSISETSTSIVLGGTFNVAHFKGVQEREGLARRFLEYVSKGPAKTNVWPSHLDISGLGETFSELNEVKGQMAFSDEAKPVFEDYQHQNRKLREAADPFDDALLARIKSCPTHVAKMGMIFEVCCALYRKPKNWPSAQKIGLPCLNSAIQHIQENMRASAYLDKYADRRAIADQAQSLLAVIQRESVGKRWGNTIYATQTALTHKFCHNTSRRGALSTSDLYDGIIPSLIDRGECKVVLEKGKKKVFAFPVEPGDHDDSSPTDSGNSPNSPGGQTDKTESDRPDQEEKPSEYKGTPEENGENRCSHDVKRSSTCVSPPEENEENYEMDSVSEGGHQVKTETVPEAAAPFQFVDKPELIAPALEAIGSDGSLALDIETYGNHQSHALIPRKGDIRLLSISARSSGDPALFDLRALGYSQEPWRSFLGDRQVIGHNLRFDAEWVLEKLGVRLPKVFCTWTAAKLLSNGDLTLKNDLKTVLERHLEISIPKEHALSNWNGLFTGDSQLQYAAEDVQHLHKLAGKLTREIKRMGMWRVMELEMKLLPVTVEMQAYGMPVSKALLETKILEAKEALRQCDSELKVKLAPWINYNAPERLLEAFAKIGVTLENTNEETLKSCEHPAAAALLQYRAWEMQRRQAVSLIKHLQPDGRIHCQFKPLGAVTGRYSSANPNLQQIKRGAMRECFRPQDPTRVFVDADYSQIELRVAAVIAQDETMLAAFREGQDLHRKTAAAVLNKELEMVTKDDRQLAKAVNFGLIFGQGADGLVGYAKSDYGVILGDQQAVDLRKAFFELYTGIAKWHKEAWESSGAEVAGRTLLGRRRLLPADAAPWAKFQAKVNFRVQGTTADIMKLAMVALAPALPPYDAHLVATVHDELIVECPRRSAEAVKALMINIMVKAATDALQTVVPLEAVEVTICENWGDK